MENFAATRRRVLTCTLRANGSLVLTGLRRSVGTFETC